MWLQPYVVTSKGGSALISHFPLTRPNEESGPASRQENVREAHYLSFGL